MSSGDQGRDGGGDAGEGSEPRPPARAESGRPLPRDTIKMSTVQGGPQDTVRDKEAPADVKALFARIGEGENVDRTVLVEQLEKMLGLVRSTAAAFDELVVLVGRRTPLGPEAVLGASHARAIHALPDGSALVHTTWTVAEREQLVRVLLRDRPAWLAEHDDPRGFALIRSSLLDVARAASSYADVLYLLGDDVTFAGS